MKVLIGGRHMNEKLSENKFRYNDKRERYLRMNKFFMLAAMYNWAMYIFYLLLKLANHNISVTGSAISLLLIVIFLVSDCVVYFKDKATHKLNHVVGIEISVMFAIVAFFTNAEFLYFTPLIMLALQIPYYEYRVFRRFSRAYTLTYTAVLIVRGVMGKLNPDVDGLCRLISVYLMLYVLAKLGSITQSFSDDALGSVAEQSDKQKVVLDGVLEISKTVQEETAKSTDLVSELVRATESVAHSMQEITSATNTTANNIEVQNNMTQSIQTAIEETGERSHKMVAIATESNESIQENLRVMEELKGQSVVLADTNKDVTESMGRLQDKTKEVEQIAGMILNISSQTNLLALNASIESARAGEAGRGFAVVAEQIRQLADQTRTSTEEITRIINELNQNANEVVRSVEHSVEATESQNENIKKAAESFESLNQNMTQLIADINGISDQISGLSDSNNQIVENISQLSAATEEVTASAEQVREMSEQNLTYAEDVKGAIQLISDKTESMKQYV